MYSHLHSPRMKFDVRHGSQVSWILRDARSVAELLGMTVEVDLRGITVIVTADSDPDELRDVYVRELVRQDGASKPVGPCEIDLESLGRKVSSDTG